MDTHPPMIMVENLAHEATNQMLRDLFAEFYPKRCRIVYRNSAPLGFAGIEFEREDQALAACRQRSGALVLGQPISCRMAEARDLSWFENPKLVKRRREQSKWDQEWERGGRGAGSAGGGGAGGGSGGRRDSGDYNPNFPTSSGPVGPGLGGIGGGMPAFAPPARPGGPVNQEMLAHQIMHTLTSIGMSGQPAGPPAMGGPPPSIGMHAPAGGMPPQGGFGGPMGGPAAPPAPRPPVTNTTDKEFAPDLKNIDIREHTFFFVDFNEAYFSSADQPIPVEIAIIAFSFSMGEKASFHRFIDPGQIPQCYRADTYWRTNSVHGIPHHGFHLAEKNYRHLYNEMTNFISQFLTVSTPFVSIYAKSASSKNNCLSWLSQKAAQPPLFCIVRNVEELIEHLHAISSSPVPSSSLCSLFASDAALPASAVSSLSAKCSYHDLSSSSSAAGTSAATSSTNATSSGTTGTGATSASSSSSSSSSIVQASHMCALANAKHVVNVVMATFNKLDVPFK